MRVVFMGTPEFAVPALRSLNELHEVLAVVCQPDRPNHRGKKVIYGAVKQAALDLGITIMQPEKVKYVGFMNELVDYSPDVITVVAYGQLLPREILELAPYGALNVHGSLLPKYRGAAPIQWALINGETQTGVTIMRMNEGLDTGDMLEKRHVSIGGDDTYGILAGKLSQIGAQALVETLSKLEQNTARAVMQNEAEATYAPLITKDLGRIKWDEPAKRIVNLIRGLNPSPGAYSVLGGKKLKIFGAEVAPSYRSSDFGIIVDVLKDGLVVSAGETCVLITQVQQEGGRKISTADYIRGHGVSVGMAFN